MPNKCGHCNGTGTCYRGRGVDDNSCDECRSKAGYDRYQHASYGIVVTCSVCGGSGWVG